MAPPSSTDQQTLPTDTKHVKMHEYISDDFIFPAFDKNEIQTGSILGHGDFGVVMEVVQIKLLTSKKMNRQRSEDSSCGGVSHTNPLLQGSSCFDEEDDYNRALVDMYESLQEQRCSKLTQHQMRKNLKRTCLRGEDKEPRYAVKLLRSKIKDEASDALLIESKLLSVINHPNIMKMRAIANLDPLDKDFFIIIDKLHETLDLRLIKWRETMKKLKNFRNSFHIFGRKKRQLKLERDSLNDYRLIAAVSLVSALAYLHDNRIIHRDLKPENVGFDVRDTLKLFDFNTSKLIIDTNYREDETYNWTACGNRRFMAPEILAMKSYNLKADVFSYAVLLWQICTLKIPYDGMSEVEHAHKIIFDKYRPDTSRLSVTWHIPNTVELLQDCWSDSIISRPSMCAVKQRLTDLAGLDPRNVMMNLSDKSTGHSKSWRSSEGNI